MAAAAPTGEGSEKALAPDGAKGKSAHWEQRTRAAGQSERTAERTHASAVAAPRPRHLRRPRREERRRQLGVGRLGEGAAQPPEEEAELGQVDEVGDVEQLEVDA